ncbi:MAG TPA: hypothetical protein VHX90_00845 [Verrucomicrobiae bacterium]|jgi:hypothetical protein|nr:hypothetical protein [Verrucomicrobiae bacterium]
MTRAEWIEIFAISVVTAASWPASKLFHSTMPLWQIVIGASALLLAQSLVRDVAILLRSRHLKSNEPRKEAQCFCLESTVGLTGVIAGLALIGLGSSHQIAVSHWEFSIAIAGTMIMGFLIKDLVVSWRPFGLRREKDHLNLIVRWKSKSK